MISKNGHCTQVMEMSNLACYDSCHTGDARRDLYTSTSISQFGKTLQQKEKTKKQEKTHQADEKNTTYYYVVIYCKL